MVEKSTAVAPAEKLRVRNLTIRYGDTVALKDASFDVRENEVFGIIGPANSGKTSFLRRLLDREACANPPWSHLHSRILARHECTVRDRHSLDPKAWALALVAQLVNR